MIMHSAFTFLIPLGVLCGTHILFISPKHVSISRDRLFIVFFLHPSVAAIAFVACTLPAFDLPVSFWLLPIAVYFRINQLTGIWNNPGTRSFAK